MRRLLTICVLALALGAVVPSASACPMCQVANENAPESAVNNARPRAYMYSILFMLAMPASLMTGFSVGFYRLWKKQQMLDAAGNPDEPIG